MNVTLSKRGRNFLKSQEGWRDTAYLDSGGKWTIGYGHTGPDVHKGMKITRPQGEELFNRDVMEHEARASRHVKVPLNQNQQDATVLFIYNGGAFKNRDGTPTGFAKKLNSGKINEAFREELPRWIHVTLPNGEKNVSKGLVNRRGKEVSIGTTPVGQSIPNIPEYANVDENENQNGYNPASPPGIVQANDPGVTAYHDAQNFNFPFTGQF